MDRYDELNRKYLNLVVEKQISDTNLKEAEAALLRYKPMTPARGEAMPRTIAHYIKRADMDQELILRQKAEIGSLKKLVDNRWQKSEKQQRTIRELRGEL